MLFLATATVVHGAYAKNPTEVVFRLVQAENGGEARAKFVSAMELDLGETAYLLKDSIHISGVII